MTLNQITTEITSVYVPKPVLPKTCAMYHVARNPTRVEAICVPKPMTEV